MVKAEDVKNMIKSTGLKQWQVADMLSMHDSNFSRMLRKDPNEETLSAIRLAINKARQKYGPNDKNS